MARFCVASVVGVLAAHGLYPWVWPLIGVCLLLALPLRRCRSPRVLTALVGLLLGLVVTAQAIEGYLQSRLPASTLGRVVSVVGVVDGLPERGPEGVRLLLRSEQGPLSGLRLRVDWADPRVLPEGGERWRLRLRLAPVESRRNPGSTDRDRTLAVQRIHGFGRVVEPDQARRLAPGTGVDALREQVSERLRARLGDVGAGGLAAALLVGDRRFLTNRQWHDLIATGTNHLVAISGLHVGLAAASAWWLCAGAWRWFGAGSGRVPAQLLASVPALLVAAGYSAMAGFSAPTQRALLMLAVVVGLRCLRRPASSPTALAVAAAALLLLDPLAPLQAGAWLSFLAVACLLAAFSGRSASAGGVVSSLWVWWRAQGSLFVGLAPATLAGFGQLSLVSPLANAVAVPLVSGYVVPLLLLSLPGYWLSPLLASGLIGWAGWWLAALEMGLRQLASLGGLLQPLGRVPPGVSIPALLLALAWIAGLGRRVILPFLLALMLCLLGVGASPLASDDWRIMVLDAGDDPVSLVQLGDRSVLIDPGPVKFHAERDRALDVLGAGRIDALIVTRGHRGHDALHAACQAPGFPPGPGHPVRSLSLGTLGRCAVLIETAGGRILFATGVQSSADWSRLDAWLAVPGSPLLAVVVAAGDRVAKALGLPGGPPGIVVVAGEAPAVARGDPTGMTRVLGTACQGAIELRPSGRVREWRGWVWWQQHRVGCERRSGRIVGRVGFD